MTLPPRKRLWAPSVSVCGVHSPDANSTDAVLNEFLATSAREVLPSWTLLWRSMAVLTSIHHLPCSWSYMVYSVLQVLFHTPYTVLCILCTLGQVSSLDVA